jgi:mono/diheme cytochrome c family protein
VRDQLRLASALCFFLAAAVSAGQPRSLTSGVYSAAQAERGADVYKAQCASCHGAAMDGSIGPPLTGDSFLANWSARPLTELADKIQKTMPFEKPGSLSKPQSADLTAYILQTSKFPSGQSELTEALLAQIVMPVARVAAASTSGATASAAREAARAPEGNLAELMRAIAFPNANIIFNLQLKNPSAATAKPKPLASSPFDYVEWGSTVYPGWLQVDQASVALTETAALLLTPGRRCQNGRPAPVDRADWKQFVAALVDVGTLAHKESRARNFEAFGAISEKLNDACANCHKVYRDKGGSEGSGARRCE